MPSGMTWPGVHFGTNMSMVSVGSSGVIVDMSDAAHATTHASCSMRVSDKADVPDAPSPALLVVRATVSVFDAQRPHCLGTIDVSSP